MVAFPTGDFGATDGLNSGTAATGYGLGLDLAGELTTNIDWVASGFYSIHSQQASAIRTNYSLPWTTNVGTGTYKLLFVLAGIRYSPKTSLSSQIYFIAEAGILAPSPSDLQFSDDSYSTTIGVTASNAFAYSAGIGFFINNKINLGIRYLAARPQYTADNGFSARTYHQSTGLVCLLVGLSFDVNNL